ncbi:MAG: hypothetical protein ACJAYN_001112 [Bermanella sp.]|uniref:hypothetical protein n=1 Tax=Glaciecola sp. 33A TaxID=2057807 RepID=UPI000C32E117|nr:hypothetical protein [Glaciecola sp. 33A]PKI03357.1 hypothetical protein CXF81_01005 [Glaciecola sp. 33A]
MDHSKSWQKYNIGTREVNNTRIQCKSGRQQISYQCFLTADQQLDTKLTTLKGQADLAQNESLTHAVNQADRVRYAVIEDGLNKITMFEEA